MKMYGKAKGAAQRILEAFRKENVSEPMANILLTLKSGRHSSQWSFSNQLLVLLWGYSDARGFNQWKQVGRNVKKGEKAMQILAPICAKKKVVKSDGTEREERFPVGFKTVNVFGYEQTEGKDIDLGGELGNWISSLPLIEVAHSWGVKVGKGAMRGAAGSCSIEGDMIGLAVENLSTWAHELIHAADIRLGNLKERGQHWASETVAELGGCVLLECLGYKADSDRGGCFQYVKGYAEASGKSVEDACMAMLNRTLQAVSFLLEEAERLQGEGSKEEREEAALVA